MHVRRITKVHGQTFRTPFENKGIHNLVRTKCPKICISEDQFFWNKQEEIDFACSRTIR